jgi:putative endonuclease
LHDEKVKYEDELLFVFINATKDLIKSNFIGTKGEDLAVSFLEKKGISIIARNWRYQHYEIDIIALDHNELVIAEVKSRSPFSLINPVDAVTRKKQRYLINAANAYINLTNCPYEIRFDIITVIINETKYEIEHIPNAFYPIVR